jgi:type II secretory pathway pseudopilin PulG
MTPPRGREDGFTFVEVIVVMGLMLVILTATLEVFATMERRSRDNQNLNDAQRSVRVVTDQLSRRLRNLASPANATSATAQQPLERAKAKDLVFRTVNSEGAPTALNPQNLQRYRYCLDSDKRLLEMRQTWTGADPGSPATETCSLSATGWTHHRVAAEDIVNGSRPVFRYATNPSESVYGEVTEVTSTTAFATVIGIRATVWVDPDPDSGPAESTLNTRVFLRNQNRQPASAFSAVMTGPTTIQLNGSASEDPEGFQLSYEWLDNDVKIWPTTSAANPSALYLLKLTPGTHSLKLRVTDAGGLSHTSSARLVTCVSIPTPLCVLT